MNGSNNVHIQFTLFPLNIPLVPKLRGSDTAYTEPKMGHYFPWYDDNNTVLSSYSAR